MIVADLAADELAARLAAGTLSLRTGPVATRIASRLPAVIEGIGLLYADHPLEDDRGFADFHVRIAPPASPRRWINPQVLFHFDGRSAFKPLPLAQAFPMLEWGMNWCVSSHLLHYLIIHAAVIERDGRAVMFPAPPGSGKSTLCAALINRGWRLLSDELTVLDLDTGEALPLARPVSLKNASIDVIRRFAPEAVLSPEVRDTVKGSVAHMKPPRDSVARAQERSVPAWIVFPRYHPGAAAALTARSKARTFMQLADNAFNYSLHGAADFDLVSRLVETCGCYDFTYSELAHAVAIFDRLSAPSR